jgi:hypothetical protein
MRQTIVIAVIFLDRADAVSMLKEISSTCRNLNEAAVLLIKSKPEDQTSEDYQLRIKVTLDPQDKQSLKEIVQKNNLSLKEDQDTVTIFKQKNLT